MEAALSTTASSSFPHYTPTSSKKAFFVNFLLELHMEAEAETEWLLPEIPSHLLQAMLLLEEREVQENAYKRIRKDFENSNSFSC